MILLLYIVGCILFGLILFMLFGVPFGGIIAFGIILGCMVRGLYLITKIHNHLLQGELKKDKVEEAYRQYLEEGKS